MKASRVSRRGGSDRPHVTLRDVAESASVSICTVSQILNGTTGERTPRYSDATRRKVASIAKRMGYRPNLLGRALSARRTYTVGLVMPAVTMTSLVAEYLNILDLHLIEGGYRTIMSGHRHNPATEEKIIHQMIGQRVDGLVLNPSQGSNEDTLKYISKSQVPLVTLNGYYKRPTWNVMQDRSRGGYLQVAHLLEVGCCKPLFLIDGAEGMTAKVKTQGHRAALTEAGLDYDHLPRIMRHYDDASSPIEVGSDMLREAIKRGMKFDSVVALSDRTAAGAMIALREYGLRVPQDVCVIGIDDDPSSAAYLTPLTTIRQSRDIGRQAAELLLELMEIRYEQSPEALARMTPRNVVLEPKLIVRESTTPTRSRQSKSKLCC